MAITGLPGTAGNLSGVPIVLGVSGAGSNELSITLDDTVKAGFVAATITANTPDGPVTRSYWNFGDSISFTGTADTDGSIVNSVTVSSLLGGALGNGATPFDWVNTLDWTPRGLTDVTVSLKYADSLTLQSPPTAANPITVAGTFNSPTLAPTPATPGAVISLKSNSTITVGAAGLSTYNLSLASTANGAAAGISLLGTVSSVNDLSLTSVNDVVVDRALTAGGTITIASNGVGVSAGDIAVSAAVTAGGDLGITANERLATAVGGALASTAGKVSATATTGTATFNATVTASGNVTLLGNTGLTMAAVAAVLSTSGAVTLESAAGDVVADGGVTAIAGAITAKATQGSVSFGDDVTASTGIVVNGKTGVFSALAAPLSTATGNLTLTSSDGNVEAQGSLTASTGGVSATATSLAVSTALVTALSGVTLNGNTGVTIGDDTSVTGKGNVTATATTGNVLVSALAPVTVVDGGVTLTATAGRIDVNALVQANQAIKLTAGQGIGLDDSGDATAAIRSTGVAGSVEIGANAQQVLIGAAVSATAGTGTVKITSVQNDVVVRRDVAAGAALTVSGKTAVDVNGSGGVPITLTSQTGTISVTSTASNVVLGSDLAFVAGPGAAAGLSFAAGTTVAVPIALSTQGDVTIVSPDGFTLNKSITSALGTVSLTAVSGALAVTAAPITAGGTITLSSLNQLDVGSTLTSTGGGISLISTGGAVNVQATAGLVATDATKGTLGIDAKTTLAVGIDVTAGNNIVVTSGASFAPVKNFTSTGGDVTVTSSTGDLDVSGSTVSAASGSVVLAATAGNLNADLATVTTNPVTGDLTLTAGGVATLIAGAITVGNDITITSNSGFAPAAGSDLKSVNGDIKLVYAGTIDVANIKVEAPRGAISLQSQTGDVKIGTEAFTAAGTSVGTITLTADAGTVTVGQNLTAGGTLAITSLNAYTATKTLASTAGAVTVRSTASHVTTTGQAVNAGGAISLTATTGNVAAGPLTSGMTMTVTAGGTATLDGAVTGGTGVTVASVGNATVSAAVAATTGNVSVTSSAGNVASTGWTVTAGGAISLTATTGNVAAGPLTSGTTMTVTAGGTATLNGIVTGGRGVTVNSVGNTTVGAAVTATTGNLTITSSSGNVDASAADAVLAAPAGSITLSAPIGQVLLNAANPLAAPNGVTLSSGGDLTVASALSSTAGGIALTSSGGDVILNERLTAVSGIITITAFDEVRGSGAAGAIAQPVLANSLVVSASYGNLGTTPLAFTNLLNDVDQLSITLASAGVPIGTGVTYVDANSLTVNTAVTATGIVDIRSMSGALTLASLGGTGQSLSGVALRAKDALSVTGSILAAAGGNIALTSDENGVSVTGGISAAQGNITLQAQGVVSVAGSTGLEIVGSGNVAITSDGNNVTIAGPVTANDGTVSFEAKGGVTGVTVGGRVFATGAIEIIGASGIQVTQTGIAVQSVGGAVSLTSANGGVSTSGDVETGAGDVTITARNGVVNIAGSVTAGVNGGDDVSVDAGPLLRVTGNVFGGGSCSFTAAAGVNLGPTGGAANTVTSNSGNVTVTSINGAVALNSSISAVLGSIEVSTAGTVTFSGGSLTAASAYTAGPPAVGLVSITGSGIAANTNTAIQAGRLKVVGSGGGNVAFTNANNQVSSLQATTAGNFTFVNAIPLWLTDFDGKAASVQVSGQNVSISSPQGLRIVDGIKYVGALTLTASLATRGVEFVPSSTGDNAAAGAAFAGTLRDMVGYVNANAATNQAMSIVFDESDSTLATTTGEITLTASLPNVVKPILFDGVLPTGGANKGGNVGVRGSGVPAAAAANGLTLGTGSNASSIRNAFFSDFAGAGISVQSASNLLAGLVIGARRDGTGAANGVGIDLVGASAARNTIGIRTVGTDLPNQIVNNTTAGVRIRSGANYNQLYGNFIGVTEGGSTAGNQGDGISVQSSIGTVIGSTTAVLGNTISRNAGNGVRLTDVFAGTLPYGAQVLGNTIASNAVAGVRIEGGGKNLVGGTTPPSANMISGNQDGIVLASSTAGVTQGNTIVGNTISASTRHGAFVDLSHGNTIDGNTVSGSGNSGIRIARATATRTQAANQVVRNAVTGNGDGTSNTGGIVLVNSSGQLVGRLASGSLSSQANTVTDNKGSGIVILGGANPGLASLNVVENNFVGVTPAGVSAANTKDGIRVVGGITNTVRANTVRNNGEAGISLVDARATTAAAGNVVAGNVVGGNTIGVYVAGGANNLIGGTLKSAGNRIFSSKADGVRVESSTGTGDATATVIRNNEIGLDANSANAGNMSAGIRLTNAQSTIVDFKNTVASSGANGIVIQGGRNNVVGSAIADRGNAITANTGDGIRIDQPTAAPNLTQAVTVAGNEIRANTGFGVSVVGGRTSGVMIGRAPSVSQPTGAENVIRDNGSGGVQVDAAVATTIVGNEIVNNGSTLAIADQIRLTNGGNGGVAAPTLTSATKRVSGQAAPQYDVSGTVAGTAGQRFFVDLYGLRTADGKQFYLGRVGVTVGRTGTGSFRAIVGSLASQLGNRSVDRIVATATPASSLNGGTSAFSNARIV